MTTSPDELRKIFDARGQGHVFAHWDELDEAGRAHLLEDCGRVDFEWIDARLAQLRDEETAETVSLDLEPAPIIPLPRDADARAIEDEARARGEAALAAGEVAAFLVAGGQGTRLGFDGPKGCFPIGPVSDRTLFRWHAEQIRARARRAGKAIPWYIMTSRANDAETRRYFEANDYLGFEKEDVFFFQQAVVPSVDFDGKLILAARDRLAMNPDGHGGSLTALVRSGAIDDMERRGIRTISYFQVDNPLVTICDPVFLGYHLEASGDMSSKILEKCEPEEKVGVVCRVNDRLTVIEYSDLDEANMYARDENGRLKYWAGSIAIHILSVPFVRQVAEVGRLPWHVARKKIPCYRNGEAITPEEPNGVKFEQFVFDALPFTSSSITMEVAREEEFAPVKNPAGQDSAESCRALLSNGFARWLEAAGHAVPRDADGNAAIPLEVSPLFALDAEEMKAKLPANFTVDAQVVLEG